jgi:hypothetical protein
LIGGTLRYIERTALRRGRLANLHRSATKQARGKNRQAQGQPRRSHRSDATVDMQTRQEIREAISLQ